MHLHVPGPTRGRFLFEGFDLASVLEQTRRYQQHGTPILSLAARHTRTDDNVPTSDDDDDEQDGAAAREPDPTHIPHGADNVHVTDDLDDVD